MNVSSGIDKLREMKNSINWKSIFVLSIYLISFLVILRQYFLFNSTPGSCDSWALVSVANSVKSYFTNLLFSNSFTTALYPAENIFMYGETAVGYSIVFLIIKLFTSSDITALNVFVVIVFTTNSFAVYLLSKYIIKDYLIAFLVGFLFSCNNFMFANIDDILMFNYFMPIFAVLLLFKYFNNKKFKYLLFSAILLAIQIYFSLYVFFFGSILFFVILVYLINKHGIDRYDYLYGLYFSGLVVLIVFPFVRFYYHSLIYGDVYVPTTDAWNSVAADCRLKGSDFYKVIPDNILYSSSLKDYDYFIGFASTRTSAFVGIFFTCLSIFGVVCHWKKALIWIILFVAGMALSISGFSLVTINLKSLLEYCQDIFPFLKVIRVPHRGFTLSLIAMAILSSYGLKAIFSRIKDRRIVITAFLLFICIHSAENIPSVLPYANVESAMNKFEDKHGFVIPEGLRSEILVPPTELIKAVSTTHQNALLLILPTSNIFGESEVGLLTYSREFLYMNHQTYFNRNMINGVNGRYPKSRVDIQEIVEKGLVANNFDCLREIGITHVLFYKDFVIDAVDSTFDIENNLLNEVVVYNSEGYILVKL